MGWELLQLKQSPIHYLNPQANLAHKTHCPLALSQLTYNPNC
jgi:hypothetical protein